MAPDAADKPEPSASSGSSSSSGSKDATYVGSTLTLGSVTPGRRLAGPSTLSTQDLLPSPPSSSSSSSASGFGSPHALSVAIPPPSSFPIPIATSIPSSSVRLSTTPLFPSPLAQASGPEEDPSRGDDGDSEGDEDDEVDDDAWADKAKERRHSSLRGAAPFGGACSLSLSFSVLFRSRSSSSRSRCCADLEFSPPTGIAELPDTGSPAGAEPTLTPRAAARPRTRHTPDARDSSPEHDPARTARAARVRTSVGRASGLSAVLHASGEESPVSRRRSRESSGLSGLGVDIRGSPTTPTSRSPALPSGFAATVGSPPSPSISMSGSSISRRSSISVASPPRHLVSGSPTSHRLSRGSISGVSSGLPLPFPAAPPPSESIKLQRVPESVRTAIDFRQPNALAAAYSGEAMSAPSGGHGFKPSSSPVEFRLPATPVATRAPSPASPTSSRSSQYVSPTTSRPNSRLPSRQGSREKLSATSSSTQPTERSGASSAHSAFAPLFNVPAAPPATRTRDRSRSISSHPPPSYPPSLSAHSTDPFPISAAGPSSPSSSSSRPSRNSPPVFNLSSFSAGPQRAVSASVSPPTHRATASFASVGPSSSRDPNGPPPVFGSLGSSSSAAAFAPSTPMLGGRLSSHRMSIAPSSGVAGFGAADSTDEYAQIILSTRNAKVRKWKASGGGGGGGPSVSTLEAGTAGTGKTWANLAEATEDASGEAGGAREGVAGYEVQPGTREIEWVDWLDEYRKMKEAKLKLDEQHGPGGIVVEENDEVEDEAVEPGQHVAPAAESKEKKAGQGDKAPPQEGRPSTPSPPRRAELAEPALTTMQKGKAPATSASPLSDRPFLPPTLGPDSAFLPHTATRYNPFEATSAPGTTAVVGAGFLTPSLPQHHDYFPLTASSRSGSFQPLATASPLTISDPFDFAPLRPTPSNAGSMSSYVGSPGKRRRNFAKLGTKIDAWWSAVRTSFAGAEEGKTQRRKPSSSSHEHPMLSQMPSIEPLPSRTSGQFARPTSPGTPTLRNIASTSNLLRPPVAPPIPAYKGGVPGGALAPAARVDSQHRPRTAELVVPKAVSSGEESDGAATAATSRARRNPHLSLNLDPTMNNMTSQRSPSSSRSPARSSSPAEVQLATSPPRASPRTAAQTSLPAPVPVPSVSPDESRLTPDHSPMWDRTPGLVPSPSMHFPVRERQTSTLSQTRPKPTKEGSKSSSFSMQTVRQQIRQRLASAKENCDKELRRIVAGITAYVETELHRDISTPMPLGGLGGSGGGGGSSGASRFGELTFDEGSNRGYSSNAEYDESGAEDDAVEELVFSDSDGASTSIPPSRLKTRTSASPHDSGRRRPSMRAESPLSASLQVRQRRLTSVPRDSSQPGERRPRSAGNGASNASSRSTSRSRSALPHGRRHVSGSRSPALSGLGALPQSSATDLAQSALIVLLQDIITVATEVLDTPISKLTSRSGLCGEYIQRVQQIGEAWSENAELPCRGWYVQLLLAVAGLSRVVEWWEAEKGFWSFEAAADGDGEPILFVAKPTADDSPEVRARGESVSSVPSTAAMGGASAPKWSPLGIDLGGDRSAVLVDEREPRTREPTQTAQQEEDETHQRADDLRQAVETIRSQTLLIELSLDGQLFQYLSSAWRDLVGCVSSSSFSVAVEHECDARD